MFTARGSRVCHLWKEEVAVELLVDRVNHFFDSPWEGALVSASEGFDWPWEGAPVSAVEGCDLPWEGDLPVSVNFDVAGSSCVDALEDSAGESLGYGDAADLGCALVVNDASMGSSSAVEIGFGASMGCGACRRHHPRMLLAKQP
mmetsp:Transcript_4823/g.8592  ORF Transcript_4823/g.8592 Transcript_4823/m.8592 type:complete len:145 (+) Transcript_4823:38-472(+)